MTEYVMRILRLFKIILVVNKTPEFHRRNTGSLSSVERDASSSSALLVLQFHYIILDFIYYLMFDTYDTM
jgi:hypothetical protein